MGRKFDDLKEFLVALKEENELAEVDVEVDPEWEVGALCREVFDRGGPALKLNHLGSFKTPLVVGLFGTLKRMGIALGTRPLVDEIREKWNTAYNRPIPPVEVPADQAPCKEVVLEAIDLRQDPFAAPRWHKYDAQPYIGTLHAVITRDPESGWLNIGNYRNELRGRDILGLFLMPYRHIGNHFAKWKKLGRPMPIAIAIGLEPYLNLVSVNAVPYQVSEYNVAGGLKGEAIKVVKAELSDLLVPASAQIVIEGEVPIDDFLPEEGPFGEFPGYLSGVVKNSAYVRVKTVTCQKNPVFQGTLPLTPPGESNLIMMSRSFAVLNHLRRIGLEGIKDVCVSEGGVGFRAIVAIEKSYPGHVRDVMAAVWGHPNLFCKHCVVVDGDIDPWHPIKVEWAVATNVGSGRDIEIVKRGKGLSLDPSVPTPGGGKRGAIEVDLVGIDATRKVEEYEKAGEKFPLPADPPQEWIEKVRARWMEYGFDW